MKFFVAFSVALIASAHAIPAGIVNTGASAVSRSDDGYGGYAFGYNEDHATGGTFRKEKGGPGLQVGSYGLRDADGRIRTVNYVADALGFRASISSNEPGVDVKQDPAATSLTGGHIPVVAPVLAHAAPVLAAAGPLGYGPGPVEAYGPGPVGYGGPGPLAAGPLGYGGPEAYGPVGHVGLPSAYSVATQHVSAGPLPLEAPLLAGKGLGLGYGGPGPLAAGPLGYGGPGPLGLADGYGKLGGY